MEYFSVDEISDQFWSPPQPPSAKPYESSKMNRSESEWAFERFLQAAAATSDSSSPHSSSWADPKSDAVDINDKNITAASVTNGSRTATLAAPRPDIPVDSDDYRAFLQSKLNLACAAVALFRSQDSPARADSGSQASNTSQLASHALSKGAEYDLSRSQDKNANESIGIPSLPTVQKKSGAPEKPTTSGSSREQSEDDENEGETEINENMDPADAKRARRMLSNRESARRSRRRKQAHLTEVETQVSQLRVENSSLLKRLTGISQKYNEAAVDNRVLKAGVETLRAKVKMAEEAVKRITGLNPMFHPMPDMSTISMPSFDGSASDTSADAAVPVQDDPKHHFYHSPNNPIPTHESRVNNGLADISSAEDVQPNSGVGVLGNKIGQTASLQRVASLEHLQKRIRAGAPQANREQ